MIEVYKGNKKILDHYKIKTKIKKFQLKPNKNDKDRYIFIDSWLMHLL